MRGVAANRERLRQLGQAVEVMRRTADRLDAAQVLDVVSAYSSALELLDAYDHQTLRKPRAEGPSVPLTYEECRRFIDGMAFSGTSELFGRVMTFPRLTAARPPRDFGFRRGADAVTWGA